MKIKQNGFIFSRKFAFSVFNFYPSRIWNSMRKKSTFFFYCLSFIFWVANCCLPVPPQKLLQKWLLICAFSPPNTLIKKGNITDLKNNNNWVIALIFVLSNASEWVNQKSEKFKIFYLERLKQFDLIGTIVWLNMATAATRWEFYMSCEHTYWLTFSQACYI